MSSLQELKNSNNIIHFTGIGGIGMSALALILIDLGFKVQGSDLQENKNISTLRNKNIKCFIGQKEENINDNVSLLVKTSIIKDNNSEIIAAKDKNIKIITRANLLAELMLNKKTITVAGTHGKSSTVAMVSVLLEIANLNPTVVNGAIINYFKSNSKLGNNNYFVAESDESDGSFIDLPSFIGVITNIEPEHLEFYDNSFEKVKSYFRKYISQIPSNGLAILCIDDKEVKNIYEDYKDVKNITTYGFDKNADIFAYNTNCNINGSTFDLNLRGKILKNIQIPVYGDHNIQNSLAVIAIAEFLKLDYDIIREAFLNFTGIQRRFTKIGEVNQVTIIDDYAHHPTEVKATINTARQLVKNNKIIAIFQPHKFSRTRDLFEEFCKSFFNADIAIIADIYPAGQQKITGIDKESLVKKMIKLGHKNAQILTDKEDIKTIIQNNTQKGDMVLFLGAGDITKWAEDSYKKMLENI